MSLFLAMVFPFQSAVLANPVMPVPAAAAEGVFRPVLARGVDYGPDGFRLSLDKGDAKTRPEAEMDRLSGYFRIGLALPNDAFWVNLRPDARAKMIDPALERTDLGRVLLEADVQLKKDLALLTSPAAETGRKYWERLYARAETLMGGDAVTIPTLSRPWIVPGEVIVAQSRDNSGAHIYKAQLKVMLEGDYLKGSPSYNFEDRRLGELNDYSAVLIRELIIPSLNIMVNSSSRYAALRQVYYALILAQWAKKAGKAGAATGDISGLASSAQWSKDTYFNQYRDSFRNGEYSITETVSARLRSYTSGGFQMGEIFSAPSPRTINELVSREHLLLDGGFQGSPTVKFPVTGQETLKLFNEALATDNRIHELFISTKEYPVKARELSNSLVLLETAAFRLGVITADDLREAIRLHTRLYGHFVRSAGDNDPERRKIYDRYIFSHTPIDNFSDKLVPWVGRRVIRWSDIPSLHTLWNILHQCILMDAQEIGIGTQTNKRIGGMDRDFVIVGKHDEHVDRLLSLFEEINKGEYSSIIIVNEGNGRVSVNISELPAGHSGIVNVNFEDNTCEWRLWMNSERQAAEEEARFRKAGFTLVSSRGNYVIGSESVDLLKQVLSVVVDEKGFRDGGEAREILEETGAMDALRSVIERAGFTAKVEPRLPRLSFYGLNGQLAGGFIWEMEGRKVRVSLAWAYEGYASQQMLTWALAALEQKGLIASRIQRVPAIMIALARETELTQDVRELMDYFSNPLNDPASESFEDRLSDLGFLTEYGAEFDEVLFALMWKDFEKYYRGVDRLLAAIPRVSRYPGFMRNLQEAILGAAGDIVASRLPYETRDRALKLVMRAGGGLFSQQVLLPKGENPGLLTDGGQVPLDWEKLEASGMAECVRQAIVAVGLKSGPSTSGKELLIFNSRDKQIGFIHGTMNGGKSVTLKIWQLAQGGTMDKEELREALIVSLRAKRFEVAKSGWFLRVDLVPGAAAGDGGTVGGIDLRSLPISSVPAAALLQSLFGGMETRVADLDAEFGKIGRLFGMGAAPSCGRIKEFVASCWKGGELDRRSGQARECLARLLAAQETRCEPSDGDTRILLAVLQ